MPFLHFRTLAEETLASFCLFLCPSCLKPPHPPHPRVFPSIHSSISGSPHHPLLFSSFLPSLHKAIALLFLPKLKGSSVGKRIAVNKSAFSLYLSPRGKIYQGLTRHCYVNVVIQWKYDIEGV